MRDEKPLDYSKLLGFAIVKEVLLGGVSFRNATVAARLGAKVGTGTPTTPGPTPPTTPPPTKTFMPMDSQPELDEPAEPVMRGGPGGRDVIDS